MKVPNELMHQLDFSNVIISKKSMFALYKLLDINFGGGYYEIPQMHKANLSKQVINFGIGKFDNKNKIFQIDFEQSEKKGYTFFDIEMLEEFSPLTPLLYLKLTAKVFRGKKRSVIINKAEISKHFGKSPTTAKIKKSLIELEKLGLIVKYIVPKTKNFVVFEVENNTTQQKIIIHDKQEKDFSWENWYKNQNKNPNNMRYKEKDENSWE